MIDDVCLEDSNALSVGQQLNFAVNGHIKGENARVLNIVLQHCCRLLHISFVHRPNVYVRILKSSVINYKK